MSEASVLAYARAQIGKPYQFGAVGPKAFDCSGLVVAAFKNGDGQTLPHFTGALVTMGTAVSKANLQPGDLVFPDSGHVQIYSGDGKVVEAPHTGAFVREVQMWGFWKARRIAFKGAGATNAAYQTGVGSALLPDGITDFANALTQEATWARTGFYVGGALLIVVGLILFAVGATPGVNSVAQLAGKVAK